MADDPIARAEAIVKEWATTPTVYFTHSDGWRLSRLIAAALRASPPPDEEIATLAKKAHQWLETVEQNRARKCECGRTVTTYIGLDHPYGANVEGCEFCAAAVRDGRQSETTAANRFDCPECGRAIGVDEDGCCRTCGQDAVAVRDGRREEPAK